MKCILEFIFETVMKVAMHLIFFFSDCSKWKYYLYTLWIWCNNFPKTLQPSQKHRHHLGTLGPGICTSLEYGYL